MGNIYNEFGEITGLSNNRGDRSGTNVSAPSPYAFTNPAHTGTMAAGVTPIGKATTTNVQATPVGQAMANSSNALGNLGLAGWATMAPAAQNQSLFKIGQMSEYTPEQLKSLEGLDTSSLVGNTEGLSGGMFDGLGSTLGNIQGLASTFATAADAYDKLWGNTAKYNKQAIEGAKLANETAKYKLGEMKQFRADTKSAFA